jgi:regulatory protein
VTHARRKRYGSRRIEQELAAKGVPEELIAQARPGLKATELEAARGVWRRKFRGPPANVNERARQLRFLQSRGFSLEIAMRVVREGGQDIGDD